MIYFGHRNTTKHDGSTPDGWYGYVCGHCGRSASGAVLAVANNDSGQPAVRWLQCPTCHRGAVWHYEGTVVPGVAFGPEIEGLPADVNQAYEEARRCMSANCLTAAELMCRKILMHVAVEKGGKEGEAFAFYIDHLATAGYVTPPMRDWVKLIKDHGNLATHRIDTPSLERAQGTLLFTAQLLRSVYEMGHIAARFAKPPTS